MKFDFLYIIGLLLALLAEVLTLFMPVHTPELAGVFFLAYLVVERRFSKEYIKWMAVMFVFSAFSMLWALDLWCCYWGLRQMVTVYIGMLASYCYLRQSPKNIINLLKAFLFVSVILVVFILRNIDQVEVGVRLGTQLNENFGYGKSVVNSNIIALYLSYALYAIFVLFFQRSKRKLVRLGVLLVCALLVYLILLTGSRKAIILLLLPFIIIPLLNKNKGKRIFLVPITVAVVVLGFYLIMYVPVLYEVLGSRVEDMINIISGTDSGGEDVSRAFLIEYGIEWFKQKPFLGHGINNFRVLSNSNWMFAGYNFYAHNNYIELLVDVGIVGTVIYYNCYFYFIRKLKGHFSDSLFNKWILVLIIVSLSLDIALVSYYSFISNLILCMCFYAVDITHEKNVKINKKYETS